MFISRKLWIFCKLQLRKSWIFCSFRDKYPSLQKFVEFFAFMILWEVKCFSAGNRRLSAVLTCERSMSLGRVLWIFWFYDSLGSNMFLCRLSWIFSCYDLWEVHFSLQMIVVFLILWLSGKSQVSLEMWIFCFMTLGGQMFLWRKLESLCYGDLWEVNVNLQIIVGFLLLWLWEVKCF